MQVVHLILFVTLGALIVAAAIWWGLTAQRLVMGNSPDAARLGSVAFVSGTDRSREAELLPRLIVARLDDERQRINAALASLRSARERQQSSALADPALARAEVVRPGVDDFIDRGEIPLPFEGRPIDISLKIGEVDVGPLLSWILQRGENGPALEITVTEHEGERRRVYGHLSGPHGYTFSVDADPGRIDAVADAVAVAVLRAQIGRRDPVLATIPAEKYKEVIDALARYAAFLENRRYLHRDDQAGHRSHLDTLDTLADRYVRWRDLQWLALDAASGAGDWARACHRIDVLSEATPAEHPEADLVARKSREYHDLCAQRPAAAGPGDTGVGRGDGWAAVAALLNLPEGARAEGVRIGLVGPAPHPVEGVRIEPAGGAGGAGSDLRDYQTTVAQAVAGVAPGAILVPGGDVFGATAGLDAVATAIDMLAAQGVDIILSTFGARVRSERYDAAIRAATDAGVLVVLPAGNTGTQTGFADVTDVALVVGSTGLEGRLSAFSSGGDGVIFAPGEGLPLPGASTGTSFSAATAAGAAALLKARRRDAGAAALRDAIAATARSMDGDAAVRVIDVARALERLGG